MRSGAVVAACGLVACGGGAPSRTNTPKAAVDLPAPSVPATSQESPPRAAGSGHGPHAPPPVELAGFRFGMSPREAAARCAAAGHPTGAQDRDGSMTVRLCRDVEVAPGTRASVAVHFCRNDSTLCEIAVFATSATDAMPLFRMFGERFQAAYGRPSDVTASSPPDDFATGCPAADAKLRYTWWWGTLSDMEGRALLALVCENGAPFAAAYLDDRDGAEAQLAIARDSGVLRP